MTKTFRTIILVVVLTATAGIALGANPSGNPSGPGARPNPPQLAESRLRAGSVGWTVPDAEPVTEAWQDAVVALRSAGREPGGLVDELGRRLQVLDEMQAEIDRIEALGIRIADWPGTDNDPLLDRLLAQRDEAILALVGGDHDLARRTVRLVSGGLGVVEAVERGWEEIIAEGPSSPPTTRC